MADRPALLLVGHGSRSPAGVAGYWDFASVLRSSDPDLDVGCGFIELAPPDLDTAVDRLVAGGATSVVAVPLVLLGAGHLKNDGPAALARGRQRHPGVHFAYARDLGIHPYPLAVAEERIRAAVAGFPVSGFPVSGLPVSGDAGVAAVVLVSRGSSDPDANADLYKVARLLWDRREVDIVEPAFVSLAPPSVTLALDRCHRLGASHIAVVPYFLFTGVLVDRIRAETAAWRAGHQGVVVTDGGELGPDPRLARLVVERYREAIEGDVRMNCDCCIYRVGSPLIAADHHH